MAVIVLYYAAMGLGDVRVNGYPCVELAYIWVMITGLGDGFAEPVGVHVGRHKYSVSAFMDPMRRTFTRSLEGSCCVAWTSYLFVALRWYLFASASAFWLTMLVLPPLMALAEAKSPHTMDTPFLFLVGALWCWGVNYVPPLPLLEPR